MPTCRTERIFFSNLRVTFFAKHHFTVTKSMHAIKLICKNVVKRFSSKYFSSILVTKHFSILKQFSEIFFSILNFFSQSRNIFIGFHFFFDSVLFFSISFFFFFDSEIFFWIPNLFSRLWKFINRLWTIKLLTIWSKFINLCFISKRLIHVA